MTTTNKFSSVVNVVFVAIFDIDFSKKSEQLVGQKTPFTREWYSTTLTMWWKRIWAKVYNYHFIKVHLCAKFDQPETSLYFFLQLFALQKVD